jgi:hypothetical protein
MEVGNLEDTQCRRFSGPDAEGVGMVVELDLEKVGMSSLVEATGLAKTGEEPVWPGKRNVDGLGGLRGKSKVADFLAGTDLIPVVLHTGPNLYILGLAILRMQSTSQV